MAASKTATSDSPLEVFALAVVGTAGACAAGFTPLLVGVSVDHMSFSEAEGGLVAASSLFGMGIAAVLLSLWVHRVERRSMVLVASVLTVAGNLVAPLCTSFMPLVAAVGLAGIGQGALYSLAAAAIAGTFNPDRNFSVLLFLDLAVVTATFFVVPDLVSVAGPTPLFLWLAFVGGSPIAVLWAVPRVSARVGEEGAGASPMATTNRGMVVMGLAGVFIFFFCVQSVWSYLERIGLAAGVSISDVQDSLVGAGLTGIAAGFVAAWINVRVGRVIPLAVGFVAFFVGSALLLGGGVDDVFGVACAMIMFFWIFTLPYVMGIVSEFDPSGRLAVVAVVFDSGGMAVGPAAAALVVGTGSFDNVIWLGLVSAALGLLVLILPAVRLERAMASCSAARVPNA